MTLAELKAQVLENVGHKHNLGDARLIRIINRCVEHVTNLVELQYKPYNITLTPATVSVVSGTLEYKVGDVTTLMIRKIVHAERTDATSNPVDCHIIDFRTKNQLTVSAAGLRSLGRSSGPLIYFRRVPTGDWYLGFPSDPRQTMTIKVYYAPAVTALATDTGVPREVPENHHELISTRATILLLSQLSMDTKMWERQYAELRQMLEADLSTWNRTGPWSRTRLSRSRAI